MNISIPIHYSTDKIRESFYKDKGYNLHDYPGTDQKFKVCIVFGAASAIFLILAQFDTSIFFSWIFGISLVVFLISVVDTYNSYRPIIKWKRGINVYLKEVEAYKNVTLTISDKAITHQYDEKTEIVMWLAIVSSTIEPGYIRLEDKGKGIILFEHSMLEKDYEAILIFTKNKLM